MLPVGFCCSHAIMRNTPSRDAVMGYYNRGYKQAVEFDIQISTDHF